MEFYESKIIIEIPLKQTEVNWICLELSLFCVTDV